MTTKVTISELPTNRIIFFLFNILLLLIGVAYIGIGSWLINSVNELPNLNVVHQDYTNLGAIMTTVGCVTVILSFLGFLLTFWRKSTLLIIYLVALIIFILFGISAGIVGFSYAATVDDLVNNEVTQSLFTAQDEESTKLVADMQQSYQCCGLNEPNDWLTFAGDKLPFIPTSCCSLNSDSCGQDQYFTNGCLSSVSKTIRIDMGTAAGISIGLAMAMIFGIVVSLALIRELVDKTYLAKYHMSKA